MWVCMGYVALWFAAVLVCFDLLGDSLAVNFCLGLWWVGGSEWGFMLYLGVGYRCLMGITVGDYV